MLSSFHPRKLSPYQLSLLAVQDPKKTLGKNYADYVAAVIRRDGHPNCKEGVVDGRHILYSTRWQLYETLKNTVFPKSFGSFSSPSNTLESFESFSSPSNTLESFGSFSLPRLENREGDGDVERKSEK